MKELILAGKIFIYPTDTIYGIGCDATNDEAVRKIRAIKHRAENPFSIIPPSSAWIRANTHHEGDLAAGPFTYIVGLKNPKAISPNVQPKDDGSIGLRLPEHWFVGEIEKAGVPFVSTSVNVSGLPFMTSLDDLDPIIRDSVDIILYEGPLTRKVSSKIDLTQKR